jgi:predicted methyltransferase
MRVVSARYLKKLQGSLKPGGRIAIIDFRMDSPDGPPKSARIAPDRVKTELKGAGYALVQEHAFPPRLDAGQSHIRRLLLICKKALS